MKKIFILLFILKSSYSLACSCMYSEFGIKDYKNAAFIVKGEVLKVKVDEKNYKKIITFKVIDSYKGKVDKIIEFKTALNGAACGVNINYQDKWLLFINEYNGRKSISLCNKNVRYNKRPKQDKKSYKESCKKMKTYLRKIKSYKNG